MFQISIFQYDFSVFTCLSRFQSDGLLYDIILWWSKKSHWFSIGSAFLVWQGRQCWLPSFSHVGAKSGSLFDLCFNILTYTMENTLPWKLQGDESHGRDLSGGWWDRAFYAILDPVLHFIKADYFLFYPFRISQTWCIFAHEDFWIK